MPIQADDGATESSEKSPDQFVCGTWYPIATAPKDGTEVLIRGTAFSMLIPDPKTAVARYSSGWWDNLRSHYTFSFVTHWSPLPNPPSSGDREIEPAHSEED